MQQKAMCPTVAQVQNGLQSAAIVRQQCTPLCTARSAAPAFRCSRAVRPCGMSLSAAAHRGLNLAIGGAVTLPILLVFMNVPTKTEGRAAD